MNAGFDTEPTAALLRNIAFLCRVGTFGYAELDCECRTLWRHGKLASWMPLGANVCISTDVFFGMEREFLDLQDENGACFTLPRVGIACQDGGTRKISVEVFWDDDTGTYPVVVHRLMAESEVELELLKQIRARRLAEENFQAARDRLGERQMLLDIVMDHAPMALAIFDEKRRYLFATREWGHAFGVECQPLLGRTREDATPAIARAAANACARSETQEGSIEHFDGGGKGGLWHRWTHRAWSKADGAAGGMLAVAQDVAAMIQLREQLEATSRQLELARGQLAHLSSIVAHDFNAPLRSMEGAIGRLGLAEHPADRDAGIELLRDHVFRMRRMLVGLADYFQTASLHTSHNSLDPHAIFASMIETLPGASSFQIELRCQERHLNIHLALFDLVLRNLLDNAIKHHDIGAGQIIVELTANREHWQLWVKDDGPGIEQHRRDAIFQPFAQNDITVPPCRTGIGLSIVKRSLEGIGGTIIVQSDAPLIRGTQVEVRWPRVIKAEVV